MESYPDTQAIFRQLAACDSPGGVRTIIENHDAWSQGDELERAVTLAARRQMLRGGFNESRVARQRARLRAVVVTLPARVSSAG